MVQSMAIVESKRRTGLPRRSDGVVWQTLVVVLHVFISNRSLKFPRVHFLRTRQSFAERWGLRDVPGGSVHPRTASALKVNARELLFFISAMAMAYGSWQVTSCGPNKPHPHECGACMPGLLDGWFHCSLDLGQFP